MKLIWKGKMTAENLFVSKDVPEDAKLLSSEKNACSVQDLLKFDYF